MPGEKVVILVPWSVHLREKIKHKIKVKNKAGEKHADCQCEEGREKELAFVECFLCTKDHARNVHLLFLIIVVTL